MRTSIAGAALLLAGAGASTAAAVTSGNNLQLNGSDTLFEVTNAVISACSGVTGFSTFPTKNVTYAGGGSGVGAGQMDLGAQDIAPMSRAMKNSEFCKAAGGGKDTFTPDNAGDLLVGLDAVSIVVNKDSSCSTTTVNQVGNPSFSIKAGGTGTAGATYTLGAVTNLPASIDALRILFMGIDQTGVSSFDSAGNYTNANFGCNSDLRKTMIKNWRNLFTTDCAAGDGHCAAGLTHAWRRPDLSGTTDGFKGVLTAVNGGGRDIGTLSNVPAGAAQKVNPFCNTFATNDIGAHADGTTNHQPQYVDGQATLSDGITTTALSDGRVDDQSDHDPIRTPCDANDLVCRFDGTLGVVLPIFIPDVTYSGATAGGGTEMYPSLNVTPTLDPTCSGSCTLIPIIKGSFLPPSFLCPNGLPSIGGACFFPFTGSNDPRCIVTDPTIRCAGSPSGRDARAYNEAMIVPNTEITGSNANFKHATGPYQYALDRNGRILSGSFFRIHMGGASSYNAHAVTADYTGICQQKSDTEQIGCLADADDCSMGYAAREAAQTFPGSGTPPNPPIDKAKALNVDGLAPFAVSGNQDQNIINLLISGTSRYELSRRLYLAAGPNGAGLGSLPSGSGEDMLAKCYSKDSLVGPALTTNGYIPIPAAQNGIQCIAYDETKGTSAPIVNTQGPGNVALGGCGSASNTNTGCANVDTAHGFLFENHP